MAHSKKSAVFLIFSVLMAPTQGARVQTSDETLGTDTVAWGRSCESLEARFQQQQVSLAEREGTSALVGSISLLRTLRRANSRSCDWSQSGDVDVSSISELARANLQQSPCYEQSRAAMESAQSLPDEERETAMTDALVMLFSEDCSTETPEAPELNEPDEVVEEEIDDATDEIMDGLASHAETSLIQQDQPGTEILAVSGYLWMSIFGTQSVALIVGAILAGILIGLLCGALVHTILRILRWIGCLMTGQTCPEYAPMTWVRNLVGFGCGVVGVLTGPLGLAYGEIAVASVR